ncbi:MAG: cyclic nucleotide-binding domain-containing protein [Archangiaceae bacterium]|nr:cyclic nucleotide-binding domain-containing protein [Archangiaceae bacterium]
MSTSGEQAMNQQPLPERTSRSRIAVPVVATPPVLRPSLIPFDVMQAYETELAQAERDEAEAVKRASVAAPLRAPLEAESVESVAYVTQGPADPEVAMLALSQVPQFGSLPRPSVMAMAKASWQEDVPAGEFLFLEGDAADSFFVVVDGTLEILRQRDGREVALRHIGRGEAIGLFGLFSGQVRAASARAIGDAVVLEVPCSELKELLDRDDELHNNLLRFYRERILEGFVGASRLFADVDMIARARIIGRFGHKNLAKGETLMHPGEVTNAILVVTHGTLLIEERARAGQSPRQFEVSQGQFLALTGAMSGVPSRMRVYADSDTSLVFLGHKEIAELMRDYPALRGMPTRLPQLTRQLDRDVFCGHTGVPGM